MERNSPFTIVLLAALLAVMAAVAFPVAGQTKQPAAVQPSKTEQLLKQISTSYRTIPESKNSYFVTYSGKELKQIDLFVIEVDEGGIAILFDVVEGKEVDLTPVALRKLLEFNMQADYIKVGLSDKGAVRVSAEIFLRSATAEGLEAVLDQAAASADEVARLIAPFKKNTRTVK